MSEHGAWQTWYRVRGVWPYLSGRFPRLAMCWCILRGWPVAYRLRIENGGFVIDGSKPGGMYVECEVIGATLVSDPSDSTARCPAGTCAASGWNAITGKNITDFRAN